MLNICRKFEFLIYQGSVSTCQMWNDYCHTSFVANFIRFPAVQNFENRLRFDKVTESLKVETFFATQCRLECLLTQISGTARHFAMFRFRLPLQHRLVRYWLHILGSLVGLMDAMHLQSLRMSLIYTCDLYSTHLNTGLRPPSAYTAAYRSRSLVDDRSVSSC